MDSTFERSATVGNQTALHATKKFMKENQSMGQASLLSYFKKLLKKKKVIMGYIKLHG